MYVRVLFVIPRIIIYMHSDREIDRPTGRWDDATGCMLGGRHLPLLAATAVGTTRDYQILHRAVTRGIAARFMEGYAALAIAIVLATLTKSISSVCA